MRRTFLRLIIYAFFSLAKIGPHINMNELRTILYNLFTQTQTVQISVIISESVHAVEYSLESS